MEVEFARLSLPVPKHLKEQVRVQAAQRGTNMAEYARNLLAPAVAKDGEVIAEERLAQQGQTKEVA